MFACTTAISNTLTLLLYFYILKHPVISTEFVLIFVGRQAILRGHESFPTIDGSVDSGEICKAFAHQYGQFCFYLFDVGNDCLYALFVEIKRMCHIVKNTYIVNDQTAGLILTIYAIGSANRLKQGVILHRLVKVHRLQNRSVKSCEQLGYMLRIDCWEAEKDLKTTPGSDCALTSLAVDEPLEYARLYLEGNLQMWVDTEDSLEL